MCSKMFIDTFNSLEAEGALDPLNEVDMFCLHFVYIPRVNKCLADFQGSWNCHSLSTEGNMSPSQLFVELTLVEDFIRELYKWLVNICKMAVATVNLNDFCMLHVYGPTHVSYSKV